MRSQQALPPDNHVHTHWSWDTSDPSTMRRACERAVKLGLPAIAFTEHLDFTVWDPDDRATDEGLVERHASRHADIDVEGYFAELAEVRDRFKGLRIWSGVETGEPHLFRASVAAHLRAAPVDRVLGSLHSLAKDGRLYGVGHLLWEDADGTMRRYLGELVDMVETSDVFQVLAHVDFPRRYWPGGTHRYVEKTYEEEYRAVFRALASTGRAPRSTRPARSRRSTRCAGSTRRAARRSASAATPTSRPPSASTSPSPSTSWRRPVSGPAATSSTSGDAEPSGQVLHR